MSSKRVQLLVTLRRMMRTPRGIGTLVILGMLLGLVLGFIFSLTKSTAVTGQTSILTQSDNDALQLPGQGSAEASATDQAAFISGEVALLASDSFRDAVRNASGVDSSSLTVSQEGTSNVVSITTSAPDENDVRSVLSTAVQLYGQARRDRVAVSLGQALRTTQARLSTLQNRPNTSANQTEIGRLLALQSNLLGMQSNLSRIVPVVSPISIQSPLGVSPKLLYPVFGLLLGGLATAAFTAVSRQRDASRTALSTLTMRGRRVLAPVLDLTNASSWPQALPVLLAQLPPSSPKAPIALVDAEGSASAETVRAMIQEASLREAKVGSGRHSGVADATAQVRSVEDLSAESFGSVVIVADSEYTTAGDVDLISDELRARGVTPAGILFVTRAV